MTLHATFRTCRSIAPSPMSTASSKMTPRAPSVLSLAARQLWRDLRSGELRLMLVSVALAVTALSAVSFFTERLQGGLMQDARALLGGDALVSADQPLPEAFKTTARGMGLRTSENASFPSMVRADAAQGGGVRLVTLKAVDEAYPLRGTLSVADGIDRPASPARHGPRRGEVWAEPSVLSALGVRVGEALWLGEARLKVSAVLQREPDRGGGFSALTPHVMLSAADLGATGLVQPASRITWRLAVAATTPSGDRSAVPAFETWARDQIVRMRGVRLESLDNARPEMRQTLDRARQFLQLVAVLSAVLAAVAVGIAARGFSQRHLDTCALLRVMGLPQHRIAALYGLELAGVGLLAALAGVGSGWALHHFIVALLAQWIGADLPAPSLWPAALGLGAAALLLAGFGLPPVMQLARVPALRVLRRELGELQPASVGVAVAGAAGYAGLLYAVAADPRMGGIALGGFALAWALFASGAWLTLATLRRWPLRPTSAPWLRLTLKALTARPGVVVLQVSALALGLMALMLLVLVRTDLVDTWRATTPAGAPNRFVINILPDQAADVRAELTRAGVPPEDWYPMFRGRLVSVNDHPVQPDDYADDRARRLVDREFNLSHMAALPAHNEVVAGQWRAEEPDGLSVEEGLARTLGLKLGDRLGFDVAGQTVSARITSLRKLNWTSMRVNFFVTFPRAEMADMPVTWISAFRVAESSPLDRTLATRFPNLTVIDVSTQIRQVQDLLDQVIRAIEFLFLFTLAAGVLVLFAALTATRQARTREFALLRALGARASLLAQVQRAELAGVGLLAGSLAAMAASATAWALATQVFDFPWQPPWWTLPAGAGLGASLALAAGWWGLRSVLRQPVTVTLRQSEG